MADEQPLQNIPLDDEKRDTVRINLPQGTAGKPPALPTPTVRLRAPGTPPVATSSTEHKKATAAISQPAAPAKPKKDTAQVATAVADSATANPKKDTARVQMPAAKPSVPEMPRPTVKLKREEPPAAAPVAVPKPVAPSVAVDVAPATISWIDLGLAVAAMLVALAVAGYLFSLNRS